MGPLLCCVVLALCAAPAAAVVGGAPAAQPEPDAAVVFVQRHGRSARLEGIKNDKLGYYSFMGIKYAEPPVGVRRFQRPVRRALAGDVNATSYCAPCPQPDPRRVGGVIGHEDCLCLNVFSPKMPGEEEGSPVIFFIHGGNYRTGSTSAYGGQHLAQKDTILVSAQYRLGSLGYLSTGQRDASGNAGLFDMRAAMAWINDYIEFFGGDPKRVVVMGQGSGGSAASLLAMSSEGRSATGVVALSGTPLSPGAVRPDPAAHARAVANRTNCPASPPERLLMCLRKMPAEKIVMADAELSMNLVNSEKFIEEISGRSGAGARVEGEHDARALPPLVAEEPAAALGRKARRVPMLTGVVSAETSRAVLGKYSGFLTNKLKDVQDFIKTEVIGGLRGALADTRSLLPVAQLPAGLPLVDYYQTLFDSSFDAIDGLLQIAEATGDALFNFPAYQSARAWSAGGPATLYSFEHVGNLTKGAHFLPGVALAEDSAADAKSDGNKRTARAASDTSVPTATGPSHGDELAYIFEPLDEAGRSISGALSGADARARASFVGLIARFAHDLKPAGAKDSPALAKFPSFSGGKEEFLKINEEVTVDKDFRYCQMGIWGNMADRLTGALCKNLIGNLLNLHKVVGAPDLKVPVSIGNLTNPLVGPSGPLGGSTNALGGNPLVAPSKPIGGASNLLGGNSLVAPPGPIGGASNPLGPSNPLGLGGLLDPQQNKPKRTTPRPPAVFPNMPFRF